MLPEAYCASMRALLGDKWDDYARSMAEPASAGLRVNPKRTTRAAFMQKSPFEVTESPLCPEGLLLKDPAVKCGAHPYHEAGVYYVQEPSAMAAAGLLNVQNGERVLDLCAAPGGKAGQVGFCAGDDGFFVCNEVHPGRAAVLCENLERLGLGHALILNETPERLARRFPLFFDKILVDAPCSGEGMFRKDPATIAQWTPDAPQRCHERQKDILAHAAQMLRPGGLLLYCTCTFNALENEGTVEAFLRTQPAFRLLTQKRLFPFDCCGEGHFMALFQRDGQSRPAPASFFGTRREGFFDEALAPGLGFARLEPFGRYLCAVSPALPDLTGLKVVRPGLQLFETDKRPAKPAHALAMWLAPGQARAHADLTLADARRYLRGEAIETDLPPGWTLACFDGYPLGWAKSAAGRLQNHRPKGLRRN